MLEVVTARWMGVEAQRIKDGIGLDWDWMRGGACHQPSPSPPRSLDPVVQIWGDACARHSADP